MNELKPCPFCGGRAFVVIDRGQKYKAIFVECEDCGARVPVCERKWLSYWKPSRFYESPVERAMDHYGKAINDAWNVRAEE
jgi:Lar family restriction alleviation protein